MKIANINSINFAKVYGVYGPSKKVAKAYTTVLNSNLNNKNLMVVDATDVYKYAPTGGILANAAEEGHTVALFIAGAKDCKSAGGRKKGWDTPENISRHLEETIDVTKKLSEEDMEKILVSMDKFEI